MKLFKERGLLLRRAEGKAKYKPSIRLVLGLGFLMTFFGNCAYAEDRNISDDDITLAIATDIAIDDTVSSEALYVHTDRGVVTLMGSSDSLLGSERAVKIAESIKGVRAAVNKIIVKASLLPDNEVRRNVIRALRSDSATGGYAITVNLKNGMVYMSGQVAYWSDRQLAADVAKTVNGVRGIKNRISIDHHIKRTDSQIKAAVKRRLDLDFYVDNAWIDISVKNGKVMLRGIVGSAAEKLMTCNDALIAGATSVDSNGLEVRWWLRDDLRGASKRPLESDEEIKNALKDVFGYDPRVKDFNINIKVSDGAVTLTGSVDNLKAKRTAEEDVKNTVGVLKVINLLNVRPINPPPDSEIARDVLITFSRHSILTKYAITVLVKQQKAYLYGSVNHLAERNLAQDITSRVCGVVEVENHINVHHDWKWKSDSKIEESIKWQFFWSPYVDSDDISLHVEDGVATLTGTVPSWRELKAAVENSFEGGAHAVINHLKVKDGPQLQISRTV